LGNGSTKRGTSSLHAHLDGDLGNMLHALCSSSGIETSSSASFLDINHRFGFDELGR
jgi:hypothetical protein